MALYPSILTDSQWTVQKILDNILNNVWTPSQLELLLIDSTLAYGTNFSNIMTGDVRHINLLMASSTARTIFGTDNTKQSIIKINQSSEAIAKLLMGYISVDPTTVDNMTTVVGSSSYMNAISGPTGIGATACRGVLGATGAGYDQIKITDMAIAKYVAGSAGIDSSTISTTAGLAGSSGNMATVAGSTGGMAAAAGSSTCMNTFAAGSTAMTAIVASTTGMSAIAAATVAMTACDVDQAQTSITGSAAAFAIFLGSAYWPKNFTGSQRYSIGIFSGGWTSTTTVAVTDKLTLFSTGTFTSSGSLSQGARSAQATFSNNITGVVSGGNPTTNLTDKYSYAAGTYSAGTSLVQTARNSLAGFSNNQIGISAGGWISAASNLTDVYSFSSNTYVAGSNLITVQGEIAGFSNSITGIIGGGTITSATNTTQKYSYATGLFSSGNNLAQIARTGPAGFSNSTIGLICAGWVSPTCYNYVDKYTYATDTYSVGNNIAQTARTYVSGFASNTIGIIGGGWTGSISNLVDRYTFSSGVFTAGNNLYQAARQSMAGFSNAHGGLYT